MTYESFDRTAIVAICAALAASVGLSLFMGFFSPVVLAVQGLIAFVAIAASRYGRRGGSSAALAASVAYVLMQGVVSATSIFPAGPSAWSLVWPIAAFGVVGIAGGQVLTMLKYDRARFVAQQALDEWSGLYNQCHFLELLQREQERFASTGAPCCAITFRITYAPGPDARASRQRLIVHMIAQQLVSGVRLLDDCARFDDGSFAVLLHGCSTRRGAAIADRLRAGIARQLRNRTPAISATCVGLPDTAGGFASLIAAVSAQCYSEASGA